VVKLMGSILEWLNDVIKSRDTLLSSIDVKFKIVSLIIMAIITLVTDSMYLLLSFFASLIVVACLVRELSRLLKCLALSVPFLLTYVIGALIVGFLFNGYADLLSLVKVLTQMAILIELTTLLILTTPMSKYIQVSNSGFLGRLVLPIVLSLKMIYTLANTSLEIYGMYRVNYGDLLRGRRKLWFLRKLATSLTCNGVVRSVELAEVTFIKLRT